MSSPLRTTLNRADEDLNYGNIYYTVFPIPASAVTEILQREENANRVICHVNDAGHISSGLMPDGKGDYFITVSKQVRDRFGLEEGDEVQLRLEPDNSAYGIPLPAEAAELWDLDPEAHAVFHRLTPGKQRGLLYQIDKLKRPESRAKRAVQIHDYLKSVDGKLDYRELNAYIKVDNRGY
jgi:bifunctional DNA-binding transcriptional regulator/antitoxin component of YhaV-PrlF toxin-antitoxin module